MNLKTRIQALRARHRPIDVGHLAPGQEAQIAQAVGLVVALPNRELFLRGLLACGTAAAQTEQERHAVGTCPMNVLRAIARLELSV